MYRLLYKLMSILAWRVVLEIGCNDFALFLLYSFVNLKNTRRAITRSGGLLSTRYSLLVSFF